MGSHLMVQTFSFARWKKFCGWAEGIVAYNINGLNVTELYIFKMVEMEHFIIYIYLTTVSKIEEPTKQPRLSFRTLKDYTLGVSNQN